MPSLIKSIEDILRSVSNERVKLHLLIILTAGGALHHKPEIFRLLVFFIKLLRFIIVSHKKTNSNLWICLSDRFRIICNDTFRIGLTQSPLRQQSWRGFFIYPLLQTSLHAPKQKSPMLSHGLCDRVRIQT